METWGAQVVASPSPDTNAGRSIRERDPDSPGSLGIAISEAVEDAATREDTSYSLGSVLNHVLLHQTVIGQEAQRQLALAGETGVDVVVGCVGGGSQLRRPRAAVRGATRSRVPRSRSSPPSRPPARR